MKNQIKAVELFHTKFGAPVRSFKKADIPEDRKVLRFNLMKEENEEYQEAVQKNDIVGIADALGDMMYILCGTIIEHGLQSKIEEVFDEIQRSNMSKLGVDGNPIYREDGKILKGPNYFKPNISRILDKEPTKLSKLTPEGKHIILIAALSGNEVIAVDGKIPWNLPDDLKHFKEATLGHHIIMGRKTFESLSGLLPNKTHIVITRSREYSINLSIEDKDKVIVVNSLEEAVEVCPKNKTSYVIGGGEIYEEAIKIVDEMNLTIVNTFIPMSVENPRFTLFPPSKENIDNFEVVSKVDHPKDDKHEHAFSFFRLVRK